MMNDPASDLRDAIADAVARDVDRAERAAAAVALSALAIDMAAHGGDRGDPMRGLFARLGDRWSVLLLLLLNAGRFRHSSLRRLVAAMSAEGSISQRMLTLRLRALEREGLIARAVTAVVPPRVDYALTPLGREFLAQVRGLMDWVKANGAAIRAARAAFDAAEGDGST